MPGRLRTNARRLNGPDRIAGIDAARGLAIIGMFAAHLIVTADAFEWGDPSTWTALVDGRSSILFATLAGVSIGLVTGGRSPITGAAMGVARSRLAVRAVLLWVIGILLVVTGVPVYVILPAYAILFLIALPLTALRARTVLWSAALLALIMSFLQPVLDGLAFWQQPGGAEADALLGWHYPFTVWIAFVLAGLGIARCGITRVVVQVRMLVAGSLLAMIGYSLAVLWTPPIGGYVAQLWSAAPHSSGLLEVIGSGGFAIAVVGGCLLLCRVPEVHVLSLPLRATGAMPLTAYAVQIIVWAIVAGIALGDTSDLVGFRALEPFWPFTIGTIIGCTIWALVVGRGPFEWLLDRAAKGIVSAPPAARLDG